MRWSRTLIPTLRQEPTEARVPSHRLMLRAGLIQQVASGAYSYLPLGWRVLRKVSQIIREEMDRAGAAEVLLPALQPIELWEKTGRRADYGDNLFVVTDRHGREQALGPTHEEVITDLVRNSVHSYRNLPLTLYQIQTKFRDEFRPRFGVLRSREFQMKDAYSFDLTREGLDQSYDAMYAAYCRIFERCGLRYVSVEAESGPIGGSASSEFMIPSPTGEDVILASDKDNYAANVEKCAIGERPHDLEGEPTGELEQVHTPGCATIEDVCAFFKKEFKTKLKPENMLKTLIYKASTADENLGHAVQFLVVAVIRGDHEVNEAKLRDHVLPQSESVEYHLEMLDPEDFRRWNIPVGFVGPHLATRDSELTCRLAIDPEAAQPGFWVSGGNEPDYHVKHFNWKRDVLNHIDPDQVTIADIRNAVEGDPSPKNDGGTLQESRGIEVGHVFKLGTKYSEKLELTVLDKNQQQVHPIMGCYGIGVNRIIAAAIEAETGHDDSGIIWPTALAPYEVVITPIKNEGRMAEVAEDLYNQLADRGIDVLLDDRDERPGVKFKDADLIGIPLRITVGDKGLKNEELEFKPRAAAEAEMVPLAQAADRTAAFLAG